jgi:hypothetical protein
LFSTQGSSVHPNPPPQSPEHQSSSKADADDAIHAVGAVDATDAVEDVTDEPLVTDALIGKPEKDRANNMDVKIGDGMDIAIHGENGNELRMISYTIWMFMIA